MILIVVTVSPAQARADDVDWGGQAQRSRAALSEWLAARGADYDTWAARHPNAAAWLEGRSVLAATPIPTEDPRPGPPPRDDSESGSRLPALLAGVGAVLLLAALALSLRRFRLRYGSRLPARRDALVAAGGGLIVSAAVGYGLTLF